MIHALYAEAERLGMGTHPLSDVKTLTLRIGGTASLMLTPFIVILRRTSNEQT